MIKKIEVSVIIPVYNKELYIEKCLDSVVNQSEKNLEIIIINDGSSDNSLSICERFALEDNRIQLIDQDNQGVSFSRNKGLDLSHGKWVYFLDADDYLDKDAFEILLDEAKSINNLDIIGFGAKGIKNGELVSKKAHSTKRTYKDSINCIKNHELKPFTAWLHLLRRSFLNDNSMRFEEDMNHNEDMLFMYKCLIKSNLTLLLDKSLYNQVLSDNSLSRSSITDTKLYSNILYVERLISFCKKENVTQELSTELNQLFKYFFVSLLSFNDYKKKHKQLQIKFNECFDKNKDILKAKYLKLARIDFLFVLIPLYMKFKILRNNSEL